MSSPTVNPFTLDLLLRCESRAYFSDTVRKIITPTRVEEATVEKDKGLIVRLVDPQTGLTHFVIAGLYPPGTLAAAVLFRAKIEDFLGKYEEEPFFVLLETDRLVDDQWADEYATDCRILEERSFSKCAAARRIEMPLQHAWQLLVDFAKQYPFYFRQRIDDVSFGTLFRESNVGGFTWNGPPSDLSAASYLMGALSVKGKLIESVTDCVLYHIFNSDSNTFKELFHTDDSSCVRNTLLAVAEKNHNLMDRITHLVVELALNQELQVRERISLYSHLNVANRVITHLSEPFEPIALHVPAKIAVGET